MIHILWPTIRPTVAMENALKWKAAAAEPSSVAFYFGINDARQLSLFIDGPVLPRVRVYEGARQGVTHTATEMSQWISKSDTPDDHIVVLASDDFDVPYHWDKHLREEFNSWNGALIVDDGYKVDTNIIPLPVLSMDCLRRLNGIIYNPAYNHFYSDEEFFYICEELQIARNLRGTGAPKFKHAHWSFNGRKKDEFDLRNNAKWDEDQKTYKARKSLPIAEKLKLPEWWK